MVNSSKDTPSKNELSSLSIQSWTLTKIKYDFTLCEKKIFLKVIEGCQQFLNKDYVGKNVAVEMVPELDGATPKIEIPIKDIVEGKTRNYKWVLDGLKSLGGKTFGVPKDEGWDFAEINLFRKIEASESKSKIRVTLNKEFWDEFYKLKVFKMIDTKLESHFKYVSTMRIYELLVGNKINVNYEIDNLKKIFCNQDTYKNNSLFIRNIIEPARKEMMETDDCPFFFEYDVIKEGRKIAKVNFIVKDKAEEKALQKKLEFVKDIKLSEKVLQAIRYCFPEMIIRDDVVLKLKIVQKSIGYRDLEKMIRELAVKAERLKESGLLQVSENAYLIGALNKIAENKDAEQEKKTFVTEVTDVKPVVEEDLTSDGFEYFTTAQLKKKAKLAGRDFDEFITETKAEKIDGKTYRIKA